MAFIRKIVYFSINGIDKIYLDRIKILRVNIILNTSGVISVKMPNEAIKSHTGYKMRFHRTGNYCIRYLVAKI